MRTFRPIAIAFFVSVVALSSTSGVANAADPVESITLSPTSKTYKVDAGQTLEDYITILNDGQTAYDFKVYTAPYSVENFTYGADFISIKANTDAYEWFQFAKTTWHIEPRETIKVPYKVHVKQNASPGGHYGVIFAETQPEADSSGLARKKRVGTLIYATVSGDVRLSGNALGSNIPWFQSSAPLQASTSIENTGNSDFTTKLTYQVSDVFGSVKYNLQNEYVVLPSTTRTISVSWNDASWFGLYKARLTTTFLDTTKITESFVLIIPIWLLLLVAAVVLSGGIYAIWRWTHHSTK